MNTEESILSREKEIEVPGSKLSEALLKIREAGGFISGMTVKGSVYFIKVHWGEVKEQGELL